VQNRKGVSLAQMRPPLQEGELVEFYRKRNGGTWTVAKIYGNRHSTSRGYRIMLLSDQRVIDKVPTERLRRHFPDGTAVKIYKGPAVGWVPSVVRGAPSPEGANEALTPRPNAGDEARQEPSSTAVGGLGPTVSGAPAWSAASPAAFGDAITSPMLSGAAVSGALPSDLSVGSPVSEALLSGGSYASYSSSEVSGPDSSDRPAPWTFVPILVGRRQRLVPSYLVMPAG